ncbi:SDR family oxidoreductase [Winogradskya consettensis]|uniref:NADH-flavin reductase n=1 Tax=Winogradskya consettensis TaxID=113560 RepID=A0A919SW45_9ACTN|nr:NAD(P)H-binding protein [Actinoplanes consettensis]GIM79741.1 NADH-flavin reductase [Actinoplanes consettensis]
MRITVFGATGGTGRRVVEQALAAGHEVTAVVRAGGDITATEVVRADPTDPVAIESAVKGRDAVISALGHRPGADTPICAPGAAAIITAMRATGVRRLLVVTASGHVTDANDGPAIRLFKPILRRFLRASFEDFAVTDALVADSGLDWTILRPPRLTNGGHKRYRTELDRTVRGGGTISRADLARALLQAAQNPATIGHAMAVGY